MNMNKLRQVFRQEKGQVMIVALVVMMVGTLVVTPSISYAATNTKSFDLDKTAWQGFYAADAGIEQVLWSLKQGVALPTGLAQTPNGMQVAITTESKGHYTLIAGEWVVTGGPHSQDLHISTWMTWDEIANKYIYDVDLQWFGPGQCKLTTVGVRLPVGYDYVSESVHSFSGNLCTDEPDDALDGQGAHMRTWNFSQTSVSHVHQKFYCVGAGVIEHDYAWADAARSDVGEVGDLAGDFYVATATATRAGVITSQVVANLMVTSGANPCITSWRVVK
jgi:hypothetical protein